MSKIVSVVGLLFLAVNSWASEIPAEWKPAFSAVQKQLHENLQAPDKLVPYYHAFPAPRYKNVYLWDSAFISLVWMKEDPKIAKDILRSLLYFQGPDGRISHIAEEYGSDNWSNPPLITWAGLKIAQESSDPAFAKEIYPKLKAFHHWFWANRRLKSGLFYWIHSYESGIDNAQRFGARDESYLIDSTKLGAIDFTSYAVLDCQALIDLIKFAGKPTPEQEKDIELYTAQAKEVQRLIREKMWDEETGYFYDRDEATGQLAKIPSIFSLFPLAVGATTPEQTKRLVAHIRSEKEFNTHIPFPTVSRSDPRFEKDCWRGPVWINTAYFMLEGLKKVGEKDLAADMGRRLAAGVYKTWEHTGKIVEYYDPDREDYEELTRKRGTGLFGFFSASHDPVKFFRHLIMKQIFLGRKPVDHFVGWTGLVNNLALEYGAAPTAKAAVETKK